MLKGDFVKTPRFLTVRISEVFDSMDSAIKDGFIEPTHYWSSDYDVLGKTTDVNQMIFAAVKKQR